MAVVTENSGIYTSCFCLNAAYEDQRYALQPTSQPGQHVYLEEKQVVSTLVLCSCRGGATVGWTFPEWDLVGSPHTPRAPSTVQTRPNLELEHVCPGPHGTF